MRRKVEKEGTHYLADTHFCFPNAQKEQFFSNMIILTNLFYLMKTFLLINNPIMIFVRLLNLL